MNYLTIAALIGIVIYWLIGKSNTLKVVFAVAFLVNLGFLLNWWK